MEKKNILILIIFLLLITPLLLFTISLTGKSINSPPSVIIISPRNTEVMNTKQPEFEWFYKNKNPQTRVLIQISKNKNFEDVHEISLLGSKTTAKTNKLFDQGTYYVRIKAMDSTEWGEFSDTHEFTIDPEKHTCKDDTLFYRCSKNKPFYCDAGKLKEDCNTCGCFENYECTTEGICERLKVIQKQEEPEVKVCSDGTYNKRCNADRKYCDKGVLTENCEICGCPAKFKCKDNQCVLKRQSFFEKLTEKMKNYISISININPTGKTILNSPPKITIKKPRENEVVNTPTPKIEWFYSDPENDKQEIILIQVSDSIHFDTVYETYWSGSETSAILTTPLKEGVYYIRIQAKDVYSWGPSSTSQRLTVSLIQQTCVDNTLYFKCSSNKPIYCDGGYLSENCERCGCFEGYECVDKECEKIQKPIVPVVEISTCSDGTSYDNCNNEQKYCDEGVLTNNCEICGGCTEDQNCVNNQCTSIQPSFKDVLITIGKFVKNKIGL